MPDTAIKKLCNEFNLSQAELSRRFGIPKRTINDWYAGRRDVRDYDVAMMRAILKENISIYKSAEDTEEPDSQTNDNVTEPVDPAQIIELWTKLRAFRENYLNIIEIGNNNPWDSQVVREMKTAFDLDPDGLTALLLLDNFRTDFFSSSAISLKDIMTNPKVDDFVSDCVKLENMLSAQEIISALEQFISQTERAVDAVGSLRADVKEMLHNRYEMAILRRDGLWSMKNLQLHQFFQGEPTSKHLAFLPDIHMFWNINSLVRCAWNSPDGVSINLVKDTVDTSSYFAFMAKNGENLTILTDKPDNAHPLAKYMSRRPERDFTNRIFKHHFPYGLLQLSWDKYGYAHTSSTCLVPLQEKPVKVGSISELLADEIIWIVMMFAQIDNMLYKNNYHCKELSYTSDMLQDTSIANQLLDDVGASVTVRNAYKPIPVPHLTMEDLDNDPQYSKFNGSGKANQWLYDRYRNFVPEEMLNGLLPQDGSKLFLMEDNSLKLASADDVEVDIFSKKIKLKTTAPSTITDPATGNQIQIGKRYSDTATLMERMTGDDFGSAEKLLSDYRFFARYNACLMINKKAQEEFSERRKDVVQWVRNRAEQNIEKLFSDTVEAKYLGKEAPVSKTKIIPYERNGNWCSHVAYSRFNFVRNRKGYGDWSCPATNAGCWFEDAPCGHLVYLETRTLEDLLYVTGCESAEELPDVLRNWKNGRFSSAGDYTGNHYLDNIDPLDWKVKNPWNELEFNVLIGVGKKHMKKTLRLLDSNSETTEQEDRDLSAVGDTEL